MTEIKDVERRLILQTGKEIREAIVKRAEDLQSALTMYDKAQAEKNEDDLFSASMMLLLSAGLLDPVKEVVRKFADMQALLKDTRGEG